MPIDKFGHHYLEWSLDGETVDVRHRRIGNVAPPTMESDAVTLGHMQAAIAKESFDSKYVQNNNVNFMGKQLHNIGNPHKISDAVSFHFLEEYIKKKLKDQVDNIIKAILKHLLSRIGQLSLDDTETISVKVLKSLFQVSSTQFVMEGVKAQIVREIYRPARRNYPRRKVVIKGYDDLFEIDLVQMTSYSRENKQFKYILTALNCFSRKGYALALKSKNGLEVAEALKKIFKDQTPKNLHSDRGKEFYNSHVKKLLTELGINHYSSHSGLKATLVERYNRTLKAKMWKRFALQGNYKWIDMLPGLVKEYNDTVHSTIGMKPRDVTPSTVLDPQSKRIIKSRPQKYYSGDYVRISKNKNVFAKGYEANFSTEIFQVALVKQSLPVTYILQDASGQRLLGSFYEHELTPVKYPEAYLVEKIVRKKGNKVLVKWLGLSSSQNTWEDASTMSLNK